MPWYVYVYGTALAVTGALLLYGAVILAVSIFQVFWDWLWGQRDV